MDSPISSQLPFHMQPVKIQLVTFQSSQHDPEMVLWTGYEAAPSTKETQSRSPLNTKSQSNAGFK